MKIQQRQQKHKFNEFYEKLKKMTKEVYQKLYQTMSSPRKFYGTTKIQKLSTN